MERERGKRMKAVREDSVVRVDARLKYAVPHMMAFWRLFHIVGCGATEASSIWAHFEPALQRALAAEMLTFAQSDWICEGDLSEEFSCQGRIPLNAEIFGVDHSLEMTIRFQEDFRQTEHSFAFGREYKGHHLQHGDPYAMDLQFWWADERSQLNLQELDLLAAASEWRTKRLPAEVVAECRKVIILPGNPLPKVWSGSVVQQLCAAEKYQLTAGYTRLS